MAAAIRIPQRVALPVEFPAFSPALFVHEGARQSLQRRLMAAFPGPVVLSITDNRHAMVTHRTKDGILLARVHHMFLDAPSHVQDALVRYVARGERDASAVVGQYIDASGDRVLRRARDVKLVTKGKHHDLLAIVDDLNAGYFDGGVNLLITWGHRGTARSGARVSIKLGSYSAIDRLIRVHPALDRSWVPGYFVEYIVFHEMLHHVVPPERDEGRTVLHPAEFHAREREFPHYEQAVAWQRGHLERLLRPLP
jgi:hypothetical protein